MAFTRKPPPGNARRVVCPGRNLRGVLTNKRGHVVQFESELEHTLVLLLERDPSVADYGSQPELLRFRDAVGRSRTYTPDFGVWRTDGRVELHEVTVAARRAQRPSLREREAAAAALCRARGWRYVVHTDESLPSGFERANLAFLAAYRSAVHADAAVLAWWVAQLTDGGPVHPRAVLARTAAGPPAGLLLNGLYHLLWRDVVQTDWRRPLVMRGDFHPAASVWLAARTVTR
ncbi:MAG TPA: TnsA endonuclease N-terminal domain-containing protein [Chloroflexota bacterium]|jgi:hypothetical protein